MKLYRLSFKDENSSAYTNEWFFRSFETALHDLRNNTFGVFYNEYTDKYVIYGVVTPNTVYMSDNGLYMTVYDEEFNVSVCITINEIDIESNNDGSNYVYELREYQGYTDWMLSFTEKAPETIKYFTSRKRARRYAAKKRFHYLSREWNNREFNLRSNIINGRGDGYLKIITYEIK